MCGFSSSSWQGSLLGQGPLTDSVRQYLSRGFDSFVLDEASIVAVALLHFIIVSRKPVCIRDSELDLVFGAIVASVMLSR